MSIEDYIQVDAKRQGSTFSPLADAEQTLRNRGDRSAEANKSSACADLSRQCFAESAQKRASVDFRFRSQFDEKLSKLFDGDKPLEIDSGKDKGTAKQNWLVVMNLATDFGGECTIEKRTNKLQELAKSTEGKPVTIVVQSAVLDEKSGKYNLERFVLKDGKVEKLKSPGESKGYGSDVEGLMKYASSTFPAKNVGLILDSHGSGNDGLMGDNGNLSLADLKTHVQTALKGSGHEKLDFLQFDACLMAQNGVLESTQSIAKHVVASAEPEGVTADTAAADNKNLAQLLKNPNMTADQLAELCVAQAKDVNGFDTLAHFDMAKYSAFRQSLDSFGEGLTKLWDDPKQQEVLRQIVGQTFEYGGGGGGGIGGLFHILGGGKDKYALNPEDSSDNNSQAQLRPPKPGFEQLLDYLRERPLFSEMPFHELPPFSRCLGTAKRDLKDFVDKVVAAIDAGKLKDEDGKLKAAAEKLLKEGESLTKSFFGRGEHKGLGGLSVFLPEPGCHGDATSISTTGGWREFQQLLQKDKGKIDKDNKGKDKP